MKKFLLWIEQKAVPAAEKYWRPVAIALLVILGLILGKRLITFTGKIVHSIFGKVSNGTFTPIAGDPIHVIVPTVNGPQVVKLPVKPDGTQVTSSTPGLAVAYAPGYVAKVSTGNAAINRK